MQVLNVAAGGDLYQDLYQGTGTSLQHRQNVPGWHGTHEIQIEPGSLLHRIVEAERLRVNSFHHQAVRRVASGFIASAKANDGVIEAIEARGPGFALGVQWHPERMVTRCQASKSSSPLLCKLVEEARRAFSFARLRWSGLASGFDPFPHRNVFSPQRRVTPSEHARPFAHVEAPLSTISTRFRPLSPSTAGKG